MRKVSALAVWSPPAHQAAGRPEHDHRGRAGRRQQLQRHDTAGQRHTATAAHLSEWYSRYRAETAHRQRPRARLECPHHSSRLWLLGRHDPIGHRLWSRWRLAAASPHLSSSARVPASTRRRESCSSAGANSTRCGRKSRQPAGDLGASGTAQSAAGGAGCSEGCAILLATCRNRALDLASTALLV